MTFKTAILSTAAALVLPFGAASAQIGGMYDKDVPARDGAEVAISGEVARASASTFQLDYGEGEVLVEMDDYDFDADAAPLEDGDRVTVYGYVDTGFFETRSIEASSVWNAESNSFHYASGADEEMDYALYAYPALEHDGAGITMTGVISSVDGREFVLSPAVGGDVEVDTAAMNYNPLDNEGMQRLDPGDRVSVSGQLDDALFEDTELSAESILLLENRIDT